MAEMQGDEVRQWAAALQQYERSYWDLVSRYIILTPSAPGEPKKPPSRALDLTAVREFEMAELNRRRAADGFHSLLRRRTRAMDD